MSRRILCVVFIGVLLGSRMAGAQTAPARAAFGECQALFTLGAFNQAIARHVDRALSLEKDFVKAQILKGELLRMKAAGGGRDAV